MFYVGIDPGAHGACVILGPVDKSIYTPRTLEGIWETVNKFKRSERISICLEQVGGFIGTCGHKLAEGQQKKNEAAAHNMFTFGENFGAWQMALIASNLWETTTLVLPRVWQSHGGIKPKTRGETQTQFKNRIKKRAQALFFPEKVTLETADALMIAHYCRDKSLGNEPMVKL